MINNNIAQTVLYKVCIWELFLPWFILFLKKPLAFDNALYSGAALLFDVCLQEEFKPHDI